MAGRTMKITRTTKVRPEKGQGWGRGKRKREGKSKAGKGEEAVLKWDSDDSTVDDQDPGKVPTKSLPKKMMSEIRNSNESHGTVGVGKRRRPSSGAAVTDIKKEDESVADDAADLATSEQEASGDDSSHEEDDGDGSEDVQKDEGATADKREGKVKSGGGGGMGDVMARILGQELDTRTKEPVLARRKTRVMREMEEESARRAEARGKAAEKRACMTSQFVAPDHTTADYERQLKKIATRGVVALFNAISKRQRG
ncbi:unnamed protein product, partial [Discosporangium mesarthrocarpum]